MNAQTKHTPGPWEIYEKSPAGHAVCDMIVDSDGKRICEFPYGWNDKDIGSGADARLIAAAPELLDVLEAARAWIIEAGSCGCLLPSDEILAGICNSIQRATGEQP